MTQFKNITKEELIRHIDNFTSSNVKAAVENNSIEQKNIIKLQHMSIDSDYLLITHEGIYFFEHENIFKCVFYFDWY